MDAKTFTDYLMFKRSGPVIIVLTILCGITYALFDVAVDTFFAHSDFMREIFEKLTVSIIFAVFGIVVYLLINRIKSERMSRETNEERYKAYINNSPDPIFICDRNGNILEANSAASEKSGFDSAALIRMNMQELWSAESAGAGISALNRLSETGKSYVTLKYVRKNGEIYYMSVNSVKIEGAGYLNICRDVTDITEMENRIRSMNYELSKKVENELVLHRKREYLIENSKKYADMGQMLTAISHHWRQPLNGLSLYFQDVCDTYRKGGLNEKYIEEFENTSRVLIDEMSDTIDNFRLFFNPKEPVRKIHVLYEIIDILKIISATLNSLGIDIYVKCGCEKQRYECKNIMSCPDCEYHDAFVYGDIGKFRHAMLNLVYNAEEAVKDLKDTKASVLISVRVNGDKIKIDIKDNGPGFSSMVLDNKFEPYISTKDGGTGIGLFMAKIVFDEHMKGSIDIANTASGALVTVTLPKYQELSPQVS